MAELQVLISTFGEDGIRRVAECKHPRVDGVEYVVSWQLPDGDVAIPEELKRDDFKIFKTPTRGLSKNRNNAFAHADADLLLISDDDVEYEKEELLRVIDSFKTYDDCDILTFMYESSSHRKSYHPVSFSLDNPKKNYYATSFEIAMRRTVITKVKFNEYFGIGSGLFGSGEEDIFIHDVLKAGFKGMFIPEVICRHDGLTTSEKVGHTPNFIRTKGAVQYHVNSFTWPLRMMMHAYRESKNPNSMPVSGFVKNWLIGAWIAYRREVFKN